MTIFYENIPDMRILHSRNLRDVPNNVAIPEGIRRLIKVDTTVWYKSFFFFNQICGEINVSIAGIMSNLMDS